MELKKGYKQTKVGLIPEDWDVKLIGDIATCFSGGTPNTSKREYYNGNINWISSSELNKGRIFQTMEFISELGLNNSSAKIVPANTFLLAMYGATAGVSAITYVEGAINQAVLAIIPKQIKPEFLFQYFRFKKEIIIKTYTQGGQPNLSGSIVKSISIPLPPTNVEQSSIATALSNIDELIAQTEKLIEKKKSIKQGVMQELLKPKEGWVTKKLGEVCDVLDNLRKPLNDSERQSMKGDIPYCGANGIVGFVNDYVIDDDIILMAEDGGYFDEYKTRPIAYQMNGKCWVNNHAHILKSKKDYDQNFIFYSLVNKNILDYINGGTRAKLNKGEMVNIVLSLPQNIIEQTKIAKVFIELSQNIAILETKLIKLKYQKQGMMQALLSGKIRLL